jgi:hypothetical protein
MLCYSGGSWVCELAVLAGTCRRCEYGRGRLSLYVLLFSAYRHAQWAHVPLCRPCGLYLERLEKRVADTDWQAGKDGTNLSPRSSERGNIGLISEVLTCYLEWSLGPVISNYMNHACIELIYATLGYHLITMAEYWVAGPALYVTTCGAIVCNLCTCTTS